MGTLGEFLRWGLTRAARVGQQTQMRPVEISAALGRAVSRLTDIGDLRVRVRGDLRPHLNHRLVPCNVWAFADLDTDYGSDNTEDWCSVKRQRRYLYFPSGEWMFSV